MKKNLEILDFEDKLTQAGKPYTRFKTGEGWMSCFDIESCSALKKLHKSNASVEVTESGEFKNIKKCYGSSDEEVKTEKPGESAPVVKSKSSTTMYVSYAKDIFCELDGDWTGNFQKMEAAIELVKQAKEAFE